MSVHLLAMSHSPLLHVPGVEVAAEVRTELDEEFQRVREFVSRVDPELVVLFAPDHYNGFFHDVMPPYCLGLAAHGVGDYDSSRARLDVPEDVAGQLLREAWGAGVDLTVSRDMALDHGALQPLEIIWGDPTAVPVVPVFINSVAAPLIPMARIRALGVAFGRALAGRAERTLVVASGGLSHDPPVPRWESADEATRQFLLAGRNPTPEFRQARQQRVIDGAREFAAGRAAIQDLNPDWDREFLAACARGDLAAFDAYDVDEMTRQAGHSVHEVRTWVAAFSALATAGGVHVEREYYRPIREFIAGFAVVTATTG